LRKHGKIDDNQHEIIAALRKIGCSVISLANVGGGCPDILVGCRGINYLIEIKDSAKVPSKQRLTPDQVEFHRKWDGQINICTTVDEAIALVNTQKKAIIEKQ